MSNGYQMTDAVAALSGEIFEIGHNGPNVEIRVGKHVLALDASKRDDVARIFFKSERFAEGHTEAVSREPGRGEPAGAAGGGTGDA